jgi:hypothetical protein
VTTVGAAVPRIILLIISLDLRSASAVSIAVEEVTVVVKELERDVVVLRTEVKNESVDSASREVKSKAKVQARHETLRKSESEDVCIVNRVRLVAVHPFVRALLSSTPLPNLAPQRSRHECSR